jgi:hypothetical protein
MGMGNVYLLMKTCIESYVGHSVEVKMGMGNVYLLMKTCSESYVGLLPPR